MKIKRIRLRNFKCFADREFALADRFNLVVGDNATGKTALLDGLAVGLGSLLLGMHSPSPARSIHRDEVRRKFYHFGDSVTVEPQLPVRVECEGSVVREPGRWARALETVNGKTTRKEAKWISTTAQRLQKNTTAGGPSELPLISYYGTGRIWLQRRQRKTMMLKPQSRLAGYLDCLDPSSDEKHLVSWFKTREIAMVQRRESSPTLEACRQAILDCLPEAKHVYYDVLQDEMMLQLEDGEVPFSYLSDGYRNMLGMAADLAIRSATLNPHLRHHAALETSGVVLIDEIDLHLHPIWQRRVVTDLMRAFPSFQFVATTHSPFVIQSLPPEQEVKLINLDNKSSRFADRSVEDIAEEVQGVQIPQRSKRFHDMMNVAEQYYKLLERADSATVEEKEQLRQQLDELILPFSDDPAYQAFLRMQRHASGIDDKEKH